MGKFNNNMLLPHNNEAYLKVIEHFKDNNRAAVVHATGTGKSYIIAAVADKFPIGLNGILSLLMVILIVIKSILRGQTIWGGIAIMKCENIT